MSRTVTAKFLHPYPVYRWEYRTARMNTWLAIDDPVSPYTLYESGADMPTVSLKDTANEGDGARLRCVAYNPDGAQMYIPEVLRLSLPSESHQWAQGTGRSIADLDEHVSHATGTTIYSLVSGEGEVTGKTWSMDDTSLPQPAPYSTMIQVDDDAPASAQAAMTTTVLGITPTISVPDSGDVSEGSSHVFTATPGNVDPGAALIYTWTHTLANATPSGNTLTVSSAELADNGKSVSVTVEMYKAGSGYTATDSAVFSVSEVVVEYLHDFTTNDIGAWSHARGSVATAPNASGAVVEYTGSTPAFYADKGLQIEPSAENYFAFDEGDLARWTDNAHDGGNVTLSTSTPGQYPRLIVTENAGTGTVGVRSNGFGNNGTPPDMTTTASCYLHKGARRYILLTINQGGNLAYATFDTDTWTITQTGQGLGGTFINASVLPISSTLAQISVTGIRDSALWYYYINGSDSPTPNQYNPSCVRLGGQVMCSIELTSLETSHKPSSLLYATSGNVTRNEVNVDAPFSALTNLPADGADVFCFQATYMLLADTIKNQGYVVAFTADGFAQVVHVYHGVSDITLTVMMDGSSFSIVAPIDNATLISGVEVDVRGRVESGNSALWVDGVKTASGGTYTNVNKIDHVRLGQSHNDDEQLNAVYSTVRIVPAALSDDQIQGW